MQSFLLLTINSLFHGDPMFCLLQTRVCEPQPYFLLSHDLAVLMPTGNLLQEEVCYHLVG